MNKAAKLGGTSLLALLLTATSLSALGGDTVYRWKDSAGNTVHSDRPPPAGTEYESISTKSNFTHKVDDAQPATTQGTESGAEATTAGDTAATSERAPKDPQLCATAKQNLDTLNIRGRIRVMGEDGEYRYLDEAEKETERAKARSVIETNCEG